MKLLFLGILAVFIYAFYTEDKFLAGAAFSPLLIIIGSWAHIKWL